MGQENSLAEAEGCYKLQGTTSMADIKAPQKRQSNCKVALLDPLGHRSTDRAGEAPTVI